MDSEKTTLLEVLVYVAEVFDIFMLVGGSYLCFYEAIKFHPNGFIKDIHLMYYLTFTTFALFFKLFLPIVYYKGDLNKPQTCSVFFIDGIPQTFTVLSICILIMKLFNLMKSVNSGKHNY